jgi:nicotinamide mononucleotide transporter
MNVFTLDVLGSIFGFLSTVCYVCVSTWAWPIGLVAILIDMYLYLKTGIYGDMALNGVYLVMTFYGWWQWKYGGEQKTELPISSLSRRTGFVLGAIFVVCTIVLATFLHEFTDSQVPWWDASTTVLSLIAQWLICRKVIQCWHLWFIIDGLFANMYLYKGIPAHAGLQLVYMLLAVLGYLKWKKSLTELTTLPSEALPELDLIA